MLQGSFRRGNSVDPISGVVRAIVGPGAGLVAGAIRSGEATIRGWRQGPALAAENERLRQALAALSLYQTEAVTLRREIASLEQLEGMPAGPGRGRLIARVTGYWPTQNRLTLAAGSRDGVEPDLPVVSAEGLVGTVDTVSESECQVLLISSPLSRIGAKIQRESPSFGITRGLKSDALTMELVGSGPAEPGDLVVTSGLSDLIPGGIPIGEVTEVDNQEAYGTRLVTLFPSGRVGGGSHLAVLK